MALNKHRIINAVASIFLALAIAAALSMSHLLDAQQPDEAQAQARKAMSERAAAGQCIRMHGLQSRHRWTDAGDLVCSTKAGAAVIAAY